MLTDKQRATWHELINRMPRLNGEWLYRAEIKTVHAVAAHLAALEAEHEAAVALQDSFERCFDYDDPNAALRYDRWWAAVEAVERKEGKIGGD